jgi:glycosyltransferase involved in cell wall biosynthesis
MRPLNPSFFDSRMRITFLLATLDLTGGNRVLSIYASMLAARGHDVSILVPGKSREPLSVRFRKFFRNSRMEQPSSADASHFDRSPVPVTRLNTSRLIANIDVPDGDVVVATWWETAEWANALSSSKGAKTYLIQHHEIFDYLPVERAKATYTLPLYKIVVAPWLKQVMLDEYGDSDVALVPNAVDHSMFYAEERSRQSSPTVGFMFSIAEFKASDLAIAVLRRLKAVVPALKVISFGHHRPVGMDFMGDDLEFHLLPGQESIRDCYSRCDVWLSSSKTEGFNLPALEAMACRTPVVSTRTGWPATAIIDGYNGYGAPVGDADALLSGLRKVLDSSDWGALSAQAFATARPLTWDSSCDLLVRALEHAIEARSTGQRPSLLEAQ